MPKTDTRHVSQGCVFEISELETSHLKNILNLHLRHIVAAGYENTLGRVWVLPPYLEEARRRGLKFPNAGPFPKIIARIAAEDWQWEAESLGCPNAYEYDEQCSIGLYEDLY